MNPSRFALPFLAVLPLSGLLSCSTEDVDCFDACVADALIIDFSTGATQGTRYVEGDLTQTFANGQWRITGNAGNGAAFGVRFSCLTNALYYGAVRVSARTEAAPVTLTWEVQSASNEPGNGECSSRGWCEAEMCAHAANHINLNPSFTPARNFSTFGNNEETWGSPDQHPFPGELIGMRWSIPDDAGEINIVVEELSFVRTDPTP